MIKKGYYYLFYWFYRLFERSSLPWLSDFRAMAILVIIELIAITTILGSMTLLTEVSLVPNSPYSFSAFVILGFLTFIKYKVFISKDRWKEEIKPFEKYNRKQRIKGTLFVFFTVLFIFGSFCSMMYLTGLKSGVIK